PAAQGVRRILAQFADGTHLDLAVVAEAQIQARRRGGGAPDFILLYQNPAPPGSGEPDARMPAAGSAPRGELSAAYAVTGEQVREWAFLGWCALIDTDKYLRRGSLWEAHSRLHEPRHHIWALWAAAQGALYPWHALSQVLDHDPADLPPGIEPPSPASTQPTCAAPRAPAREYSPRSACPPPDATRQTSPQRWPPTSPAHSPVTTGTESERNGTSGAIRGPLRRHRRALR